MATALTAQALQRLFALALGALDLEARVTAALPLLGAQPVRIVAIGKGAPAMAKGALAGWRSQTDRIEQCLVVAPDGTAIDALMRLAERLRVTDRVHVLRAGHPLPDARSVRAASACLELVSTDARREILVLVSGGASALVCAPAAGVTLREKRQLTQEMLRSGASIQDLNAARRKLSRIKGGGLARAAAPNRVTTLIASDIIRGSPADVGSGPSITERTKRRARIIASPEELARAFAELLRKRGDLTVEVLPPSQASAEALAAEYVALATRAARASRSAARAFVRAAEPSVIVPRANAKHHGGRSTHLAALVGRALLERGVGAGLNANVPQVVFGAFASDGVDGESGTAGAIIDSRFALRLARRFAEPASALARSLETFDTGTLHRAVGTAIAAGPTGHNLADLHVLITRRREPRRARS